SFVVTNPTHYAVALAWDEETMEAPELIAKGEGDLARRIMAEAHRHGIAVLRDAPLARSLHELEIGDEIPEALYEAVAAVAGFLGGGGAGGRWGGWGAGVAAPRAARAGGSCRPPRCIRLLRAPRH